MGAYYGFYVVEMTEILNTGSNRVGTLNGRHPQSNISNAVLSLTDAVGESMIV